MKLLKKRSFALTTDLFLIALLNKMLMVTYINLIGITIQHLSMGLQKKLLFEELPVINLMVLVTIFGSYFFLSYRFFAGQTPGKWFFSLKVVRTDGRNLTFFNSLLRSFGHFVCYALGLALFAIPFMRKDGRGLPDWLACSEVVDLTPAVIPVETSLPEEWKKAA